MGTFAVGRILPDARGPSDGARPHSEHFTGPSLEKVDGPICCEYLLAWLHMMSAFAKALNHLEAWFKACPCNRRSVCENV